MKNIKEVVDSYDNVDFKDRVVGSSVPSKDRINTTLLNDINKAAKNAGVTVDVTTAVSGHKEKTSTGNISRHGSGNAVDISIINNTPVRSIDKKIIDRFVGELQKMGYVRGTESGNPKAVLDYTFKGGGHKGHIHVSNTTNTPSKYTNNSSLKNIENTPSNSDGNQQFIEPEFDFIDYVFNDKLNEELKRIKELL